MVKWESKTSIREDIYKQNLSQLCHTSHGRSGQCGIQTHMNDSCYAALIYASYFITLHWDLRDMVDIVKIVYCWSLKSRRQSLIRKGDEVGLYIWDNVIWIYMPKFAGQSAGKWLGLCPSATTLLSIRNTRVCRTALTAPTEPHTLWWRITCLPSPRWRVSLHTYLLYFTPGMWWCIHPIRRTCVLHSLQWLQLCCSSLHNDWRCLCLSKAKRHILPLHYCYISNATLSPYRFSCGDVVTYYNTVFSLDTLLAIAFASPSSYFTDLKYTVKSSPSLVLCPQTSTFCIDPSPGCDASSTPSASASAPFLPTYPLTSLIPSSNLLCPQFSTFCVDKSSACDASCC